MATNSELATAADLLTESKRHTLASAQRHLNKCLYAEHLDWVETNGWFLIIEEGELWRQDDNCASFEDWFNRYYPKLQIGDEPITIKTVRYRLQCARVWRAISRDIPEGYEGKRPNSANQLRAFFNYTDEPTRINDYYWEAVRFAEKTQTIVTGEYLKDFIKHRPTALMDVESSVVDDTLISWAHTGVSGEPQAHGEVDLGFEPVPVKHRSVAALSTLTRIEEASLNGLLPAKARELIDKGVVGISNAELEDWGRYTGEDFIRIGRLVFREDYPMVVQQAYRFMAKANKVMYSDWIEPLISLAIAERGELSLQHQGFQIDVAPIPKG